VPQFHQLKIQGYYFIIDNFSVLQNNETRYAENSVVNNAAYGYTESIHIELQMLSIQFLVFYIFKVNKTHMFSKPKVLNKCLSGRT
jgi:hypothetical protein